MATAVLFLVGAGVSFIPSLAAGAGLLTLGGFVLAAGVVTLAGAFGKTSAWDDDGVQMHLTRMGLIVIGGFLTAAMILAADWAVRLLSRLTIA